MKKTLKTLLGVTIVAGGLIFGGTTAAFATEGDTATEETAIVAEEAVIEVVTEEATVEEVSEVATEETFEPVAEEVSEPTTEEVSEAPVEETVTQTAVAPTPVVGEWVVPTGVAPVGDVNTPQGASIGEAGFPQYPLGAPLAAACGAWVQSDWYPSQEILDALLEDGMLTYREDWGFAHNWTFYQLPVCEPPVVEPPAVEVPVVDQQLEITELAETGGNPYLPPLGAAALLSVIAGAIILIRAIRAASI